MDKVQDVVDFAYDYMNIVAQPHQIEWIKHFYAPGDDKLILGPRGHGKTLTLIEIILVYEICHNPQIKILLASHKEAVARRQARMIQLHLMRKKIREDFGITKDSPWTREEFYIKHKGESHDAPVIFAVSGDGGMTGYRFDIIVFDDLLVKKNQKTETLRLKLKEWVDDEVLAAGDPGVKTLIIGTRKHYRDWYSTLLEDDLYSTKVDSAIKEDGSFLWPWLLDRDGNKLKRKFDHEELEKRKRRHGPRSFAQEYLNQVAPAEGMLLERSWIKYYDETPPKEHLDIYMGVDPSLGSEKEGASSIAIAVVAADRRVDHKQIYVLDLYKQQISMNKQIDKIKEYMEKWNPSSTNIEAVFYHKHLAQHIKSIFPNVYPIDYSHTRLGGQTDASKEKRIMNLIGWFFSEGKVSMRDPNYDYDVRQFIETEYIEFPEGEMDLLDALNLAVDLVDMIPGGTDLPLYSF